MRKVFCNYCKWFKDNTSTDFKDQCKHPSNMVEIFYPKESFTLANIEYVTLNKKNNCKNYKKKWWYFWKKN